LVRSAEHVLGLVVFGYGRGVRGALIDTSTGTFLRPGAQTTLSDNSTSALADAARKVTDELGWEGRIGCCLPGLLTDRGAVQWLGDDSPSPSQLEQRLEQATGCRVTVSSVAAGNGQGEMRYGFGQEYGVDGLTLICTVGRNFGVALFEDGKLVPNLDVTSITDAYAPEAGGPPDPNEEDFSVWRRYAEMVDRVLLQLESVLKPDRVVLGGPIADGFERLHSLLNVSTRIEGGVHKARLGAAGAVKGAAYGAEEEFKTRDALERLKQGIGQETQISPQRMTREQLEQVFNRFDASRDGNLSEDELEQMLQVLGVANVSRDTVHEMLTRLDTHNEGMISWQEFTDWWQANIVPGPVRLVVSSEEFDEIVDETPSSQLICLEVGMTFCRPCKAFEPKLKRIAGKYDSVQFLRLNGNENGSCTTLARDRLGVRSTPSFYFFRGQNHKPVHFHSGANEDRLVEALDDFLQHPEKVEEIDVSSSKKEKQKQKQNATSQQQQEQVQRKTAAAQAPAGGGAWSDAILGTRSSARAGTSQQQKQQYPQETAEPVASNGTHAAEEPSESGIESESGEDQAKHVRTLLKQVRFVSLDAGCIREPLEGELVTWPVCHACRWKKSGSERNDCVQKRRKRTERLRRLKLSLKRSARPHSAISRLADWQLISFPIRFLGEQ
jgi:thioredoxin 1